MDSCRKICMSLSGVLLLLACCCLTTVTAHDDRADSSWDGFCVASLVDYPFSEYNSFPCWPSFKNTSLQQIWRRCNSSVFVSPEYQQFAFGVREEMGCNSRSQWLQQGKDFLARMHSRSEQQQSAVEEEEVAASAGEQGKGGGRGKHGNNRRRSLSLLQEPEMLASGGGGAAIQFRVDSPPRRLSSMKELPCKKAVDGEVCFYAAKMNDCMMMEASGGEDAHLAEKMESYLKLWRDNAHHRWYCAKPTRGEKMIDQLFRP
eukprot:GHVS01082974.1.p1 GENE.GHVS01082974.1~~GHVS01082974.1.p1  ORF type:complete len:260 (-),score=71.39 GHVS01082974.1:102-881(-)